MSRMVCARLGVPASAVVALATLMTDACGQKSVEEVETTAAVPVAVVTASAQTLVATIAATGVVTIAPGAERIVVAPEAARIAELPYAEGEAVKSGDLLVRFEIPTLGSDLAARRAARSGARESLPSFRPPRPGCGGASRGGGRPPPAGGSGSRARAGACRRGRGDVTV